MEYPDDVQGFARVRPEQPASPWPWPVYRRGTGPSVIVIHELTGLTDDVIAFADRVQRAGFSVYLPVLFGSVPSSSKWQQRRAAIGCCISREINVLASGRTSRVVGPLRALAADIANPMVGVIGMCMSGGFALAMASGEPVTAAVASQPSLPFTTTLTPWCAKDLSMSPADVDNLHTRLEKASVEIYYTRFSHDKTSPARRLTVLKERVGAAGLHCDVIPSGPGNDFGFAEGAHSVLASAPVQYPDGPAQKRLLRTADDVVTFLGARLRRNPPPSPSSP